MLGVPLEVTTVVKARSTEVNRNDSMVTRTKAREVMAERRHAGGRPKGSKNKPKSLIPAELASEFLDVVKPILPEEYFKEMQGAVRDGKAISTLNEAKIMLKLIGPTIWRRLIEETRPATAGMDGDLAAEIGQGAGSSGEFRRDINERLKVWMGILQIVDKIERDSEPTEDKRQKPLVEVFARSGVDSDRIRLLIGVESGPVGGNVVSIGGSQITVGALPDTVPQRQVGIQDSQEVETTRVLDGVEYRNLSLSERQA